jgi:pimeloyl-ACP methyl ester carboxylesterase
VIKDYPPSERPLWQLIGREALAMTAAGLLFPFGLIGSSRRTPRKAGQRTVVFVHGYMANSSTFLPLMAYLKAKGVADQVLSFDYRSPDGIEKGARDLKDFLRRRVRGGTIDLVCHSLGGLVARVYLQELGGARRVERCVTLATPHKGTYNAYWISSRVGRELRPDSELLHRIEQSRGNAEKVRFTSIVAGSDSIVVPRVFAADEETVHVPDLGHVGMLFSPTVFKAIGRCLE